MDVGEVAPTRYLKSKRNERATELTATVADGEANGQKTGTDDETMKCSWKAVNGRQIAGTAPTPGKAAKIAKPVQRPATVIKKDAAVKVPPEKRMNSMLKLAKPKTMPNQRGISPAKKAIVNEKQQPLGNSAMIGAS